MGVNMALDYLRHDKFYDPEQDIWIDAVKIGDQYMAGPIWNPSSETILFRFQTLRLIKWEDTT